MILTQKRRKCIMEQNRKENKKNEKKEEKVNCFRR